MKQLRMLPVLSLMGILFFVLAPSSVRAGTFQSQFFGSDATAAQIATGVPYDMNSLTDPFLVNSSSQNRSSYSYKIFSSLFMLGYQTEMAYNTSYSTPHLLALHAFQSRNGLPVSNLLDSNCLAVLDQQLATREQQLAPLGQAFLLYDHMQQLAPHDISKDTLAAIYALPMSVLPAALQMANYETVQCITGQCNGFIQDTAGNTLSSWPTPIDLASDYRFAGAYFDPRVANARMPSAAVHVDTVLHEYAHYLDGTLPWAKMAQEPHIGMIDTSGFYGIGYDMTSGSGTCFAPRSGNALDWISKYAKVGSSVCADPLQSMILEDWAETFSAYVSTGRDFRAAAVQRPILAQKYDWLKVNVFNKTEYDTNLPHDLESGCNDVPGTSGALPGYLHCNDNYVWDFTLPAYGNGGNDTPASFSFTTVNNAQTSTLVQSEPITVAGIATASPITIVNGEYAINGGSFTPSAGWVNNGDRVLVRLVSAATAATTKTAVLMIGGVSGGFAVTTVLAPPTISGNPGSTVIQGTSYSFTPMATGATSFSITNKPGWASFNTVTGRLSGTPNITGNFADITIAAHNVLGDASLAPFNIGVTPAQPHISGTPTTTIYQNGSYSFTPTCDYSSGFMVTNGTLPPGLEINPNSGTIQGTATTPGIYVFDVTVINYVFSASLPVTITVMPKLPAISGTPPGITALQTGYSFTPSAASATSFRSSGTLPPGLTIDAATGALTGKPATIGVFTNIVITADNSANGLTSSASLPPFSITVTGTAGSFATVAALADAREEHTATLLNDGTVLVVGGYTQDEYTMTTNLASVERYGPATGDWTPAAPLSTARFGHTAMLLNDGSLLVSGGAGDSGVLTSAERYDPAGNRWQTAGTMAVARTFHRAALLADGNILAVGGLASDWASPLASAEIYDPVAGGWRAAASMAQGRMGFDLVPLPDGTVLAIGGISAGNTMVASAEIYDPDHDTWRPAAAMATARAYFSATRLTDGRVLVAGGYDASWQALTSAEIYNPANNSWQPAPSMASPRSSHTATLLPNSQVLVSGANGVTRDGTELYDPVTNTWQAAGPLHDPRIFAAAVLLPDGTVLVTGGEALNYASLASVERYTPASPPTPTTVTLNITITGSGTVTSQSQDTTSYACNTTGACAPMTFRYGDVVTLAATGSNSSLSGWSGDIGGSSNPHTGLVMDGDKSVTCSFTAAPATVRIDGDATPFHSIATAITACTQDTTIRARDINFSGDAIMDRGHTIVLRGGYSDSNFTDAGQTGYSTISGLLLVEMGTLIVDRVQIGP